MNQLVLSARIAQANALRYTPADLSLLRYEGYAELSEAGQARQVKVAVKAVAFGSVAETLGKQAIGSGWQFTGFLATPRNGKHPVFHIQSFTVI